MWLLVVRLLQTSILTFFETAKTQAAFGMCVCLLSTAVHSAALPFHSHSDHVVSVAATWSLFLWMFAVLLMSVDVLTWFPEVVIGTALVIAAASVVVYVAYCAAVANYKDDDGSQEAHARNESGAPQEGGAPRGGDAPRDGALWTRHFDEATQRHYYHSERRSTWTSPVHLAESDELRTQGRQEQGHPEWTAHEDPATNVTYYHSERHRRTTWTAPDELGAVQARRESDSDVPVFFADMFQHRPRADDGDTEDAHEHASETEFEMEDVHEGGRPTFAPVGNPLHDEEVLATRPAARESL